MLFSMRASIQGMEAPGSGASARPRPRLTRYKRLMEPKVRPSRGQSCRWIEPIAMLDGTTVDSEIWKTEIIELNE